MAYLDHICHPSILVYSRTDTHQLLGYKFAVYNYCMYHYSWNHIFPENILKIIKNMSLMTKYRCYTRMGCAHSWVTALFGHSLHMFDNETRQLVIV